PPPPRLRIDQHVGDIENELRAGMPAGVSPSPIGKEEAPLGEGIADEEGSFAGLSAAEMAAKWRRNLEKDFLEVRTEHREEDRDRSVAKLLGNKGGQRCSHLRCRQDRTQLTGGHVQQVQVLIRGRIPVWTIHWNEICVWLSPAKLAPACQQPPCSCRHLYTAHHPLVRCTANVVVHDVSPLRYPLLACRTMRILRRNG